MNTFHLTAADNHQIHVRYWPIDQPKAIVQIVHGMNEHSNRYDEFARFLNNNDFTVYATDHRGHGQSARNENSIGYIGDNGFHMMVDDQHQLSQLIQSQHPHTPHFLLGHSMGSFIIQRYIQLYGNELAGTLLIGSGGRRGEIKLGALVAEVIEKVSGDKRSKALEKIVFNGYNSRFRKRTGFEWLANDPAVVDAFLNDPLCGHIFPPSFYRQFLTFMLEIFEPEEVRRVPTNMPLFILSGSEDPVGQYGKGTDKLHEQYKEIGLTNLRYKLYPGERHEILNDYNRQVVFQDIANWLNEQLEAEVSS